LGIKIVSILAILSGLLGLACGLLNWALYFSTRSEESYGGGFSNTLMDLTWLGDSAFTGLAVVLLGIGFSIQAFKKTAPTNAEV
tara:strand:- start:709 stop:960 length:252 start_codon:yes stop_codon:yes gene_type:complete